MEYVMYGKLLQHLREQRSRQTSFFQFSEGDVGDVEDSSLTAKDLTKYAYGVAKGMEFIVSKGVNGLTSFWLANAILPIYWPKVHFGGRFCRRNLPPIR